MNTTPARITNHILCLLLLFIAMPTYAEICLPELGNGAICTAKDFQLVDGLVSGPPSCTEGEIIPGGIVMSLGMQPTANERYDIGIFVGDEDQSPIGGSSCTFSSLTPLETGGDFDPVSGNGPYRELDGNACGDTKKTDGFVYRTIPLNNVLCQDLNGDGKLDISFVMTWQQNQGECPDPNDPNNFTASSSKCVEWVGDVEEVEVIPPIPPPLPVISVSKSAVPHVVHAPGEEVSYTINIANDGPLTVTLESLTDTVFGDLNGKGTCAVPQLIGIGGSYSCIFAELISGRAGDIHTNTVTATVIDENSNTATGSDSATVSIIDGDNGALGELVWFDINGDGLHATDEPGIDGVTIDLLRNGSFYATSTTANGGQYDFTDLPHGSYRIEITDQDNILANAILTGGEEPHDVELVAGEIYLRANFGYALAAIKVHKTPDKHVIHAPGEDVTFTVSVENIGPVDVMLSELVDDTIGDLDGKGSCSYPQSLVPAAIYSCAFTELIGGTPLHVHKNTVTASAIDAADNAVFAADGAFVEIIDGSNGSIGDLVWLDQNLDRIRNLGEIGIDNVTLDLMKDTTGDGIYETLVDTTTTLFSGAYSFTDLPAGSYQVVVTDIHAVLIGLDLTHGTDPHQLNLGSADIYDLADFGYSEPPLPLIQVVKRATVSSIHAPGADVAYVIGVRNTGNMNLTLSSLLDSKFGNLNGKGSCIVPQTIAIDGLYFCAFNAFVAGDTGDIHTNVVFAIAEDSTGNVVHDHDSASVDIIDSDDAAIGYLLWNDENADGIADPGEEGLANVTLNLLQDVDENGSFETTIGSKTTSASGTYAFEGLAAGSYRVEVTDDNNILAGMLQTGGVNPHDISLVVAQIYASANFGYSRGAINVIKLGDKSSIHAPGESVAYTITIENEGYLELTLTSLVDDKFGDLALGGCTLPQPLLAQSSYSCSFSVALTGDVGDQHTNIVTAIAEDAAGNQIIGTDEFVVTFIDSLSGAIGDKVWLDSNRDGIQDPLEDGLSSVTIELWQDKDTSGSYDTLLGEELSNADGEYAFINLGEGSYRVMVTDRLGIVSGMNLTGGTQPHDTDLAVGQLYPEADFGYSYPPVPGIQVVKNADVPSVHAPGGSVNYTVSVQNSGETVLKLINLADNKFGNLDGQGDCILPQEILQGNQYFCSFTGTVSGAVGDIHTNEVLGSAEDGLGGEIRDVDTAQVDIIDSSDAAIGYRVWLDSNGDGTIDPGETGLDNVTLTLLQDTDLDGTYETTVGAKATVVGGVYAFLGLAAGNYRVMVSDNNNILVGMVMTGGTEPHDVTLAMGQIFTTANFGYAQASMTLIKSADVLSVEEPGGPVAYTVTLTNTGPVDITADSLTDNQFGDLGTQGDCKLPQLILAGASYSCSFTAPVMGNEGEIHINTVVARTHDSEGNPLSSAGSWLVKLVGSPPPVPAEPFIPVPAMSEPGRIILYLLMFAIAFTAYRRRYYP